MAAVKADRLDPSSCTTIRPDGKGHIYSEGIPPPSPPKAFGRNGKAFSNHFEWYRTECSSAQVSGAIDLKPSKRWS